MEAPDINIIDFKALPKDFVVTSGQFTRRAYTSVYPAVDPTSPENSLAGKVVVVTGASRGIGAKGISPAFVQAGVKAIVLMATSVGKLESVRDELKRINPKVDILVFGVDVTSKDQVNNAWSEIKAKYARVHILVNNAGVQLCDEDKTHQQDPDDFFKNFEVNVKGVHLMTHQFLNAAVPWATKADPARVINITSSTAWGVRASLAPYAISKAAVINYTTHVAASYPGTVLAIAVNPGLNETDIIPQDLRESGFDFNDPMLTGANLVWLVANPDRSRFLNGRALTVEWDVEELVARKEEITSKNLLTMQLNATLGIHQFQ